MNTHTDFPGTGPRRRRSRGPVKALTAGAVGAAVAAGGAYATGLGPFGDESGPDPEAVAQARAFLADWSAGHLPAAAARTTRPDRAEEVLRGFTAGLDIDKPKLAAGQPEETGDGTLTVPFTARMPVTGLGTWTYTAKLPLREQGDGAWKVDWKLSLATPVIVKYRDSRTDTRTELERWIR